MALKWDDKDPDDIDTFSVDWTNLLETGETISTSGWTCADEDLVIHDTAPYAPSISGANTIVWLAGGVAGVTYEILNRIVTSTGRQLDQTVKLKIKEH